MEKITSPLKAIRCFCIECMGGQVREVKDCTAPNCPLYAFRMGKNPYLFTEEQRQALTERLKKANKAREANKKV